MSKNKKFFYIYAEALLWMRELYCYSVEDLERKLSAYYEKNPNEPRIKDLEAMGGKIKIHYTLLKRLAEIYKRSVFDFQYQENPSKELSVAFRGMAKEMKLNTNDIENMRKLMTSIVVNREYQFYLDALEIKNTEFKRFKSEYPINENQDIKKVSKGFRMLLGIDAIVAETNVKDKDIYQKIKEAVEKLGIYVFEDDRLNKTLVSGYCIYDEIYPIIVLNSNDVVKRKIFTLFHEVCHILMGKTSLDTDMFSYDEKIEKICNAFSANTLVPDDTLHNKIMEKNKNKKIENRDDLNRIVRGQKIVSEYCIALRLKENRYISEELFKSVMIKLRDYDEAKKKKTDDKNKKKRDEGTAVFGNNKAMYEKLKQNLSSRYKANILILSERDGHSKLDIARYIGLDKKKIDDLDKVFS